MLSIATVSLAVMLLGMTASATQDQVSPCSIADTGTTETPTVEAEASLDGRLGGTADSFEDRYGENIGLDFLPEYDVDQCGAVFAAFFEDEIVTGITLFSPRKDETTDADKPHDEDWSVDEATDIATRLFPPDAETDDSVETASDNVLIPGSSDVLLEMVPTEAYDYVDNSPEYGDFSATLLTTTAGDVYMIVISLEIE